MNWRAKSWDPIGCPRNRVPPVISLWSGCCGSNMVRACLRHCLFSMGRESVGEIPVVVVRMSVFCLLRSTPKGRPSSLNRWMNQGRSLWGRQMDVSSMMEAVWAWPPLPSSCVLPDLSLAAARSLCSLLILVVRASRTRQEKRGLRGQPWGKPSVCISLSEEWFSLKYHEGVAACVNMSKRGMRGAVASWLRRIFRASVREVLLNILWRSKRRSARVGVCGSTMYLWTAAVVVWATKSIPPWTCMPYCPPATSSGRTVSETWTRATLAVSRRSAVLIPMGLRRSRLFGSL